ncbi:MAG: sigma-70 family RNA polymerase sigma factor [Firmicutes bacterium]|nr:sigma-70 family RNA polymerase sigma factor [Bacillota bacterium]MBQ1689741.1 sigma-70 family RNA polymerase sigma factor [Bacillota bacterium]MBQ1715259.1 sigma-70 family RNA polymerase sigma factor [Bacillota bacterium]MBQ2304526.1 sigma-70 family RNA polymerase sigma factor [Bacillota bacterium]
MTIENLLILTDEQLAAMAKEGSETAEEILIDKYKGLAKLKAKAYFIAGGDQEDVVQEGMIGLMKAVRNFDPEREASFKTFASTCITNQIIKAIRNADREKNHPLNEAVSLSDTVESADENLTIGDIVRASMFDEPEQKLIYQEMVDRIVAAINANFSQLERDVFRKKLEGKNYIDIARELGKSPKTVDNAIQRVRHKVTSILDM